MVSIIPYLLARYVGSVPYNFLVPPHNLGKSGPLNCFLLYLNFIKPYASRIMERTSKFLNKPKLTSWSK